MGWDYALADDSGSRFGARLNHRWKASIFLPFAAAPRQERVPETESDWPMHPHQETLGVSTVKRPSWVVSMHCRLAASGKRNSTGRFPAMNLDSGLTQPDPLRPVITSRLQRRVPEAKRSLDKWIVDSTAALSTG